MKKIISLIGDLRFSHLYKHSVLFNSSIVGTILEKIPNSANHSTVADIGCVFDLCLSFHKHAVLVITLGFSSSKFPQTVFEVFEKSLHLRKI